MWDGVRVDLGWGPPSAVVLRHVGSVRVDDTTYLVVSLKNGAAGSSSIVRLDHPDSNISYVVRPSRIPWQWPIIPLTTAPMLGVNP